MRIFMKLSVVLLIFVAVATAGEEGQQPIPEGTTVKLLLLRQKSVQEELKLAAESKNKISEFTNRQHEAFLEVQKLSAAERKQKLKDLEKENAKFVKNTLSAKQHKRLDQIAMQFAALHHLLKPDVTKSLKLSDDQVEKFKDLQKESRKALVDLFDAKESDGRSKKFARLREDTRTKILAVLTESQKTRVREMAGPVFNGEIVFEEPESPKQK